ncbi:hypothetical protein [Nocardioides bruguierae]|uniref:hypothetical protein n=1 Tax=Nocardioides bruguierae TaxID=2945102 RepID=UPI0020224739|nr:hypothetical protein [Nocardioides bruguierae]MCL8027488.1 hypothetical protein [Nocardioides bruguierae]
MSHSPRTRVLPLLLLAGLLGASFVPPAGGAASASCAGPSLDRVRVVAGDPGTVTGQAFVDGCDDGGGGDAFGCTSEEPEPVVPLVAVDLVLVQDGSRYPLGTADADASGAVTWDVTWPNGVTPGRARLVADDSTSVDVRVVG